MSAGWGWDCTYTYSMVCIKGHVLTHFGPQTSNPRHGSSANHLSILCRKIRCSHHATLSHPQCWFAVLLAPFRSFQSLTASSPHSAWREQLVSFALRCQWRDEKQVPYMVVPTDHANPLSWVELRLGPWGESPKYTCMGNAVQPPDGTTQHHGGSPANRRSWLTCCRSEPYTSAGEAIRHGIRYPHIISLQAKQQHASWADKTRNAQQRATRGEGGGGSGLGDIRLPSPTSLDHANIPVGYGRRSLEFVGGQRMGGRISVGSRDSTHPLVLPM
ncbi:hypothetical protein B0T17DRAFT_30307 [Bombardia bombarda]|uniref:Uncharacterized protein n=1 Tax=Bombardia bombarda TaxID=252184 RepID=A0AA40CEA3_9PEZI|nr:hypothetical protein B0T17DRAFT_30307 [Bombardia bombarda]